PSSRSTCFTLLLSFFTSTISPELSTLSLHDALPILSVAYEYLGLEGGPPMFRQDYTCPALLESSNITFAYGTVTRYGQPFQTVLLVELEALAWSAFARHY